MTPIRVIGTLSQFSTPTSQIWGLMAQAARDNGNRSISTKK
jgi:hypothetical protein